MSLLEVSYLDPQSSFYPSDPQRFEIYVLGIKTSVKKNRNSKVWNWYLMFEQAIKYLRLRAVFAVWRKEIKSDLNAAVIININRVYINSLPECFFPMSPRYCRGPGFLIILRKISWIISEFGHLSFCETESMSRNRLNIVKLSLYKKYSWFPVKLIKLRTYCLRLFCVSIPKSDFDNFP